MVKSEEKVLADVEHGTREVPRAGVVGLGMIGGGVAVSLARSGRIPAVFDIRSDAADKLAGVPSTLPTAAEVARVSDVVLVAVVDADQARSVLVGEDGLLASARPGMVIVLLSTVAVPVVHELAALCAESGVSLLDCGVTPGDKAAQNGLVAILGGPDDAVAEAMPVLEDFAKVVIHCGPLGSGMATKIARNVVTYGSWRVVREASLLAALHGVELERLVDVIEAADPEGRTLLQMLKLQLAGFDGAAMEAAGVLTLLDKDLAAAQDLASELGLEVPLVDVARREASDTLSLSVPERPS
jgi:3-hydroxyisobutyrate dehydrogenase-like beta-hydroxyacid dehydrogenase